MKIQSQCLHCLLRQISEALDMTDVGEDRKREIMAEELKLLSHFPQYASPPHIAGPLHRLVCEATGCRDPYHDIKEKDMETARKNLDAVRGYVDSHEDRLYWSIAAAAAGNTLDSAANPGAELGECIARELETPFAICDIDSLRRALDKARNVLILADNSGETYFDTILIDALLPRKVVYAVRSCPSINDATIEIAERSGIGTRARIIASGSRAPGTILDEATPEFRQIFDAADVVISKGQGNYEGLCDLTREVFCLFKVKCPVISAHFGAEIGKYVLKKI